MKIIQALNDGADEEDFKQLLEILKGFGQVEVLYDPSDPKDRNVTADEVVDRYKKFKKWYNSLNRKVNEEAREDGSSTEECISGPIKIVGGHRRRSRLNETDTTISTAS